MRSPSQGAVRRRVPSGVLRAPSFPTCTPTPVEALHKNLATHSYQLNQPPILSLGYAVEVTGDTFDAFAIKHRDFSPAGFYKPPTCKALQCFGDAGASVGFAQEPKRAIAFYSVIAAAGVIGAGLTLSPIDPIKALYWSAVINGVVAPPVMIVMMLMTANRRVMGQFVICGWLRYLGWTSTAAMVFCVVGMAAFWIL